MREITLYKMKPIYMAGEIDNLIALKDKLKTDQEVLAQIEQDYYRSQDEFKRECIAAKKNHLLNLHFYYWFVLKKYFDDALVKKT